VVTYFADTSFWIGLSSKRDQHHRRAVAWNQFMIRTRSSIVTTEAVLWEWLNGFSDASTRGVAAEGYRRVHADPRIEVVPFQPELIDSAVHLYRARPDKDWSLTDCPSFVVMERRHLTEALTTDGHFEQAGLKVMMPVQPPLGI
jgi:predicted nucleic acid-binding protein